VDSSEEKIRKPNPEIYLRTLTRLGVSTPGAAIFLDDFAPNVDAARELGLHGILVDPDPRSALAALNDLLD
jgi:putative hydrolase of the HAD superfamily